jgi:hypothetical protein
MRISSFFGFSASGGAIRPIIDTLAQLLGKRRVFHFVGRVSTILVILPFNTAFLWEASCQAVRVKGPLFR